MVSVGVGASVSVSFCGIGVISLFTNVLFRRLRNIPNSSDLNIAEVII